MSKYRINIARFFLCVILSMLTVESMPHTFDAHGDDVSFGASSINFHKEHDSAEEGILHSLYDVMISLSETHGHTIHEHILVLVRIITDMAASLFFLLFAVVFFTPQLFFPVKHIRLFYRDIPPFYRSIHLLARITRGPPALI